MGAKIWSRSVLLGAALGTLVAAAGCYARAGYGGVLVYDPPPPARVVVRPYAPGAGYVWVDGYWNWSGNTWLWVDGYWTAPRAGYIHVQPRWVPRGRGWAHVPGGWRRGGRGTVQVRPAPRPHPAPRGTVQVNPR